MSKVKVAVIGCGYLGKWHVEKVISHESAELVAIVEPSPEGQSNAKEKFPEEKVVSSVDEVLSEIDAAIIATPTSIHFELVEKLILAKKHVFCEKPLTDDYSAAEKLGKLEREPNQVIQVGHSERFHKVWKTLKEDKELSSFFDKKACIDIDRYAPFKGRATDVDVVSDLMIHDLDLLWFLFGEKPIEVSAAGHKVNTNKWDHATAVLKFSSGRRAILTSGRSHVEEQRKVQIIGEKGTLLINLMDLTYTYAKPGATTDTIVTLSYDRADHLYEEQDCFYKSILNQEPPPVSLEDGIIAVSWIDAVQKSLEQGKAITL